jgi:hypothetical protein
MEKLLGRNFWDTVGRIKMISYLSIFRVKKLSKSFSYENWFFLWIVKQLTSVRLTK